MFQAKKDLEDTNIAMRLDWSFEDGVDNVPINPINQRKGPPELIKEKDHLNFQITFFHGGLIIYRINTLNKELK